MLKYRFIALSLMQIQDIEDYSDSYKVNGALIFVDFIKSFESLEYNLIKLFGFNGSFIY